MTKRKKYIWAELKLPTRIPDRIARIGAIIERVDGNPRYPTLQPIVTALKPAYAELRAAQVDVASGPRGLPAVRDRKLVVCEQLLEQLRVGVEWLANADLENGASIIVAGGRRHRRLADWQVRSLSLGCRHEGRSRQMERA